MRLWSLHPKYLDQQGLCGLWREAIMARNALEQGEEHGYFNHPQLDRFKRQGDLSPDATATNLINYYLKAVFTESKQRGFNFDGSNINPNLGTREGSLKKRVPLTNGQLEFERRHLCNKLKQREPDQDPAICEDETPELHPLFYLVDGPKADWEGSS